MPDVRSLKSCVCRGFVLAVAAFVLIAGSGGPAHAEPRAGAKPSQPQVDHKLVPGFTKVVKASGPIFTARVLRKNVRLNQLLGHGRRHPFVESVRLQVRILQPLKGASSVEQLKQESPRPWLIIPNGNIPRSLSRPDPRLAWQFELANKLKRGDRVVVYLRPGESATIEKRVSYYHLQHLNRIAMLPTLQKALAIAFRDKLIKLRSTASCKALDTWRLEGGCHAPAALAGKIRCPDGAQARWKQERGFLSLWCETAAGEARGPYLKWVSNGDLGWRGKKQRGQLHGTMVLFQKSGKPGKRIDYQQGKMHGQWIDYHPNGRVRVQGQMVNDIRDGEFKRYDKAGKLLGSYTLKRGSGLVTEWYEDGHKQREMRFRRGKMHGPYKVHHGNGQVSIVGKNRNGHAHGKWFNYNGKGELEVITCYRNGREIWDTTEVRRGKRRPCR